MPWSDRSSRIRGALGVVLAYAVVLLVSPALHDARDCFHDTPEHCVACLANPVASPAEEVAALTGPELPLADRVEDSAEESAGAILIVETPGRAPPLH